jgi:hypothetical protein
MNQLAGKLFSTLNAWPLPITRPILENDSWEIGQSRWPYLLKNTACIYKYITLVFKHGVAALNLKNPFTLLFVPARVLNLVLEANILISVIFLRSLAKILMYLLGCRIVIGPLRVWLKRIGVIVCWYIALTSWIPIKGQFYIRITN